MKHLNLNMLEMYAFNVHGGAFDTGKGLLYLYVFHIYIYGIGSKTSKPNHFPYKILLENNLIRS